MELHTVVKKANQFYKEHLEYLAGIISKLYKLLYNVVLEANIEPNSLISNEAIMSVSKSTFTYKVKNIDISRY